MQTRVNLNSFDSSIGLNRGVSKPKEVFWYLTKILFFLSALPYPSSFKAKILKLFGAKIGKGVIIKPRVNIHMPWKLAIGDHSWIGEEVFILNFEPINIGSNVCISQRSFLCGGNHDYKNPSMPYRNGPITLQDGCWIGASCFIAPNTVIGIDTVVVACSSVRTNLSDNMICEGNPAKPIKPRWTN